MWTVFLALLACNPNDALSNEDEDPTTPIAIKDKPADEPMTLATTPARRFDPTKRPMPKVQPSSGELITRDCYGSPKGDRYGMKTAGAPPPPIGATRTRRPRPQPSPRPSPSPPVSIAGAANQGGGVAASDGLGSIGDMASGRGASSGEGAVASAPPARKEEAKRRPKAKPSPAPSPTPSRPMAAAEEAEAPAMEPAADRADYDSERSVALATKQMVPRVEWDYGATVYLSNDDSMSLASAQRLLWAVDQGRSFSSREVRPHELLNYFSFDTVQPDEGDLFSVLGSAEAEGDTLSVALAVQGAMPAREPLDLSLVIDRSGSMRAEGRMEYVKRGLMKMTESLRDGDRVDLALFDSSVCTPVENFVVGRDDMSVLTNAIRAMQPRGSTDLDGGLREGYRIQTGRDEGDRHRRNQRILLLTDAFLNTGNVDQSLVSEIGKRFEDDGIRVTGIGVGRDFNDKMLDLITEKGKGAYVYLGSEAVVDRVFGSGFDSLTQTIAHDVQFSIELPDSLAMKKFYGEESSTNAADVQPINYYAGTSQVFLQDLKIKDGKAARKDRVTFRIKYREADTGEPAEQTFTTTIGALLDGDTHNLNKAQALMAWTDLLAERSLGDRSCSSLRPYRRAAAQVQGDAEIAYVSGLTGKLCGVDMSETVAATGVAFKVKLDADQPIAEVKLDCGGESWSKSLGGGTNVARFDDVYPGTCRLQLGGVVPMTASVEVPKAGGDVRCLVRGGRLNCD